jgi:hypothetical protein
MEFFLTSSQKHPTHIKCFILENKTLLCHSLNERRPLHIKYFLFYVTTRTVMFVF